MADDYIRRKDAINEVHRFSGYLDFDTLWRMDFAMGRIPNADVAPVKHGSWENSYRQETDSYVLACSCCGSANSFGYTRSNYCPNCGADMRKDGW